MRPMMQLKTVKEKDRTMTLSDQQSANEDDVVNARQHIFVVALLFRCCRVGDANEADSNARHLF